jgi:hypothetical protein
VLKTAIVNRCALAAVRRRVQFCRFAISSVPFKGPAGAALGRELGRQKSC